MNEPRVVESVTNECQSLGRAHESSPARAEQLIACLEGEIAKRDAELAACRVAVENCDLFRARIAELEQDLAYFPSTVRSLAETVTEREAEINQLRAELAAIKAQGVVMPDVNAAAKALCNRHAMICGVDADDQWKEYSQDFIADAETVLANSRLCAATVLEVNAHCAVIPEPYGWVAAGSFYTDRESAICAAEKTPCIDVYSRPQMNALENRSLQRQELAEELARQLNASCAEIRNMRNLYAAPVSVAKAQGVVMPERKTKADYGVYIDEFADEAAAIYNAALDEVARLNAAPAQQVSVPVSGVPSIKCWSCKQTVSLDDRADADGNCPHCRVELDLEEYLRAMLAAAPAAPAADASDVLEQAMYTLISIGYHENSGLVHELRQALAAHRAKGVV